MEEAGGREEPPGEAGMAGVREAAKKLQKYGLPTWRQCHETSK
jgi:hypothetical protein